MGKDLKPYKDFKPFDGYPVRALSFNPRSSHFLAVCNNAQAKVYTSEGVRKKTTARGDMYLRDMNNTRGHVAALTDGQWNPCSKSQFVTSSSDGTLRLWDMYSANTGLDQCIAQSSLFKCRNEKGQKVEMNAVSFSGNGNLVIGGTEQGQIQIFDIKKAGGSFGTRPQI